MRRALATIKERAYRVVTSGGEVLLSTHDFSQAFNLCGKSHAVVDARGIVLAKGKLYRQVGR